MEQTKELSISELVNLVVRKKKIVIWSLILSGVPIIIYNEATTPIYRSSTMVVFEDTKDKSLSLALTPNFERSNYIANQILEMKTKDFSRRIYDELSPSVISLFPLPDSTKVKFDRVKYIAGQIRANLYVESIRATDVLVISFEATNPQLAQAVANTAAQVLKENNLQNRRQQYASVKSFIDEQLKVVSDRLKSSEDALRDFKEANEITSLDEQSKEVLQRVTQAEVVYNQVRSNKDATKRKLDILLGHLKDQKADLARSVTQVTTPMASQLKEKLVELEVRYASLQLQNYPENHPKMIELKAQIDQIKKNLITETLKITEGDNTSSLLDPISEIRRSLEESIQLDIELQALQAQENHLRGIIDSYSGELRKLPESELNLVRLTRDKEVNNKIYIQLLEEREQARIKEAAEIGSIRIMEPAGYPAAPIKPRRLINILIGLFAGLTFGLVLVFLNEYARDSVRSSEDVEKDFDIPVVSSIPKLKLGLAGRSETQSRSQTLLTNKNISPAFVEAYSFLWTSLRQIGDNKSTVIMITSVGPGEGKSTVASNFAIINAERGNRTILIDGDLRRPVLHSIFAIPESRGLTEFIQAYQRVEKSSRVAIGEEVPQFDIDDFELRLLALELSENHETNDPLSEFLTKIDGYNNNLILIPSGSLPKVPADIWTLDCLYRLLRTLKQHADVIIIDGPPIIGLSDVPLIAEHVDQILFVVRAGATSRKLLKRAMKSIEHFASKIQGIILNAVEVERIYGDYKYYKYYNKMYHREKSRSLFGHWNGKKRQ